MNLQFKWIGGATWLIRYGNITIASDPVLCPKGTIQDYQQFKSTRLNDPAFTENDFRDVNLWVLSHGHEDHVDEMGLRYISNSACIINHQSNVEQLFHTNIKTLSWGQEYQITCQDVTIDITAIPAIHAKYKFLSKLVGDNNGYILKLSHNDETTTIYYTGDDVFRKRRFAKYYQGPIDLIIANAGAAHVGKGMLGALIGRITNNFNDLRRMAKVLKPKVLIPIHWGTFSHYLDKPELYRDGGVIKIVGVGETVKI